MGRIALPLQRHVQEWLCFPGSDGTTLFILTDGTVSQDRIMLPFSYVHDVKDEGIRRRSLVRRSEVD